MHAGDRVAHEQALRSAVLAGDERAWRAWYDQTFESLYAYGSWRCGGLRELTEDAVQESWLTAMRRIRDFDPDRGCFAGWLRGIAANILRNRLRQHARRARSLNGQAEPTTSAGPDWATAERTAAALAALPERYEAVLRAKYLDQQSVAEIAEATGDSPKAVESLLTRARQAFRDAYARWE